MPHGPSPCCTLDTNLDQPNGVEWLDGALYVATARALLRYDGVLNVLRGIEGFMNAMSGVAWARPVDVQRAPRAAPAFFVSDDKGGAIFRFAGDLRA